VKFNREQYINLMTFGDIDRQMFSELFGPLIGLDHEWRDQGASEDEIDMTAFDWDYVPYVDCGGICTAFNTTPAVVIEEDDEYRIERDFLGRTMKLCKATATLPLPMDYPVSEPSDWERVKHFYTFDEARILDRDIETALALQRQGHVVRAEIPGAWDMVRELMGEEQACVGYYCQPELMRDIMNTIQETSVKVLERVTDRIQIDQLYVHEDMAGRGGPLIGPKQVTEFVAPYYQACWDCVSSRGTRLFNQDSDGFMMPVMDAFLACGVNVMHPFEPAAGMDIVEVRKKYGKQVAMIGGIDKHVLRKTRADIRRELEYKMQPMMQATGGMIYGLDHRIPNGTPLENYRFYVKLGREILDLPPLDGSQKGWGRMAF
jgi:hypothetical protein